MKKVFILILIFFCLAIVCSDTSEAARYNPDLTVSRVTVDAVGNNTGGLSINNVGNRPTGQYEVLVYFKRSDGSYFKQLYRTGNQTKIYPNQTRHYANVFDGSQAVTGLVRVNPHQRFTELDYYNNVRYFSMQKKSILSYNVTEGVRRYDVELGYDVVTPTYTGSFSNGVYNPILGDSYIEGEPSTSVRWVNGIRLYPEIPDLGPPEPNRLIVRGVYPGDFQVYVRDTIGNLHGLTWDSENSYYYAYVDGWTPTWLRIARLGAATIESYQILDSIQPITIEINDQGIDTYHPREYARFYNSSYGRYVQVLIYEDDLDNGEYDPVTADPPYILDDFGTQQYVNWIELAFNYVAPPYPRLVVRGVNPASNFYLGVLDENYNAHSMTWDSVENYYYWESLDVPLCVYLDAADYASNSSYLLLDSIQNIWIEYDGTNVTGYNVTEGNWQYRVYDEEDYIVLFTGSFLNGEYDPIQADPPYYGDLFERYYVNHLELTFNLAAPPTNAVSTLLIIKGLVHLDDPPKILFSNGTMVDMSWSQSKSYYFMYNVVGLLSMIIDVWDDDYWAYDLLDSFSSMIVEYLYMPRSWSWS